MLDKLQEKISRRESVIGVIGLGYVGLPVACCFAQAGFQVIGLDVKADRVAAINAGQSPIGGREPGLAELLAEVVTSGRLTCTTDYGVVARADIVLIDVETPTNSDNRPEYVALKAACRSAGQVLQRGALIIVESTIAPSTIDEVVRPLLEETTGWRCNADFFVGACPERVMPGKLLHNLRHLSRVCGGSTPETAKTMRQLYQCIVEADLDTADCVTAELVKTAENAYRDVNIAFANELALACEVTGGDFLRVRELVNKSPGRNVLLAGAGVGGHCIPKDSWLLVHGVSGRTPIQLIAAARSVNTHMPYHMVDLARQALHACDVPLEKARVALLGMAYLENSDDLRNSPSLMAQAELERLGVQVQMHDPFVPEYRGDVETCIRGCDAVLLMVAHDEYRQLDLAQMRTALRTPIVIDGRRVFDPKGARAAGLVYRAVGVSPVLTSNEPVALQVTGAGT